MTKKDRIVRTEKEFLKALENIDANTLIIFDDGYPIKIDARKLRKFTQNNFKKKGDDVC